MMHLVVWCDLWATVSIYDIISYKEANKEDAICEDEARLYTIKGWCIWVYKLRVSRIHRLKGQREHTWDHLSNNIEEQFKNM